MSEKSTLELSHSEVMTIKYCVEGFIARAVYRFIYANSPHGYVSAPSLTTVIAHFNETNPTFFKIHDCLRDRLTSIKTLYLDDMITDFYSKCVYRMKWNEEHPAPPGVVRARLEPQEEIDEDFF